MVPKSNKLRRLFLASLPSPVQYFQVNLAACLTLERLKGASYTLVGLTRKN
jgi:hypothetical protein